MECKRCGNKTNTTSVSYLSTDNLCMDCLEKEKSHVLYEFGKKIEHAEVLKGNFTFPGILHGIEGKEKEIILMAQIKYGDTLENMSKTFNSILNNFSFNGERLANTFTINGIDFVDECKSWVYYMANTDRVDGRNMESKRACMELNIPEQPLLPFAEFMSREHRTLQQSYTGFVLSYLLDTPNNLPLI